MISTNAPVAGLSGVSYTGLASSSFIKNWAKFRWVRVPNPKHSSATVLSCLDAGSDTSVTIRIDSEAVKNIYSKYKVLQANKTPVTSALSVGISARVMMKQTDSDDATFARYIPMEGSIRTWLHDDAYVDDAAEFFAVSLAMAGLMTEVDTAQANGASASFVAAQAYKRGSTVPLFNIVG